ncbi:D-alanine--poly(phosphoribitol) ligase subunit DltA [Paenibacillus sp. BSR1-1]|uniref:D-alanine--poly(phosphoribitol) ligase subunit DltA n=1 Tax=Paenibacillus sp. BSR1-1 TaxID=3020845 RepID=UPI0025AF3089|nr:D-alanine--poly(phosphoribitol) ligase subunit DltA [Paenibacillus sp. BSR1-1]MDN3015221.1 D-alanine--poly(phosphoribitol) ligase subunit DltA [Paenibacillus sp. BSR1-1]
MRILNTIRELAQIQPETLAYISPSSEISYSELWRQSEQVADFLLNQDLQKQSPILVYGHMEASMLVSFIGSVKSGHPYIPVDTSIPSERVINIINSARLELVINCSGHEMDIDNSSISVVTLEDILLGQPLEIQVDPKNWVESQDNFYIIYTSGSTGNPKGVQISAANLESFVDWMIADFPINGPFRFLNQAPYSFDLSVMDLYPALVSGGTLFAITKEMIARPKLLFEALYVSNTQIWTSTPSFVQMCLMDPSFNEELLPNLSVFLFCGEILPVGICRQLFERFPKAKIFNTYGPTEATVAVTSIEVTVEMLNSYPYLPIGKPKEDTQILFLDENGNEVSTGENGEMVIVGPSVSKGYFGQQELTERAFSQYNEHLAYRTGDAGYQNQEGLIFYKGRIDFQIKLHGYRMELEEIEFHIAKSKFVKAAAVIPVFQNEKIDYLEAVIIPDNHDFEKEYQLTGAIKKELGEFLPAYMIPRKFSYHKELPITANGKLDRKTIKEMMRT